MPSIVRACWLVSCVVIAGCTGTGISDLQRAERSIAQTTLANVSVPGYYFAGTFDDRIKSTFLLSEEYLSLAEQASLTQDTAAFGLIAAAATAAGAVLFGAHPDLIAGAGLGAGVIVASERYLKPTEAANELVAASNRLICVIAAARRTGPEIDYKGFEGLDNDRKLILSLAVAQIRGTLYRLLQRETPNYGDLVRDFREAAARVERETEDKARSVILSATINQDRQLILEARNKLFDEAAAACVLPT